MRSASSGPGGLSGALAPCLTVGLGPRPPALGPPVLWPSDLDRDLNPCLQLSGLSLPSTPLAPGPQPANGSSWGLSASRPPEPDPHNKPLSKKTPPTSLWRLVLWRTLTSHLPDTPLLTPSSLWKESQCLIPNLPRAPVGGKNCGDTEGAPASLPPAQGLRPTL